MGVQLQMVVVVAAGELDTQLDMGWVLWGTGPLVAVQQQGMVGEDQQGRGQDTELVQPLGSLLLDIHLQEVEVSHSHQ